MYSIRDGKYDIHTFIIYHIPLVVSIRSTTVNGKTKNGDQNSVPVEALFQSTVCFELKGNYNEMYSIRKSLYCNQKIKSTQFRAGVRYISLL